MKRNALVLLCLVIAQLAIAYALKEMPGKLVDWSSEIRLGVAIGVFLGLGAVAFLLFRGGPWKRIVWSAVSAALPALIAEALSWSDPAYPKLGYLVMILLAMIASIGALITYAIIGRGSRGAG
jgi:hypothetical protein